MESIINENCGEFEFMESLSAESSQHLMENADLFEMKKKLNGNGAKNQSIVPSMMQIGFQMGEKFGKMENKIDGMEKGMAELWKENSKLKEDIAGIKQQMDKGENSLFQAVNCGGALMGKIGNKAKENLMNITPTTFNEGIQQFWYNWARPIGAAIWKDRIFVLLLIFFLVLITPMI